jgi:hypothetical protein
MMVLETIWMTRTGWLIVYAALVVGPWHRGASRAHRTSRLAQLR